MKRLLCLISNMNTGGAETFLMKIYRKIDRKNYQIDFCINNKEESYYEKEILSLGGKVYHIPSKSENLREFKRQLAKIVKENSYEYVLRLTSSAMGFMDLKISKKAGAKVCSVRSTNSSSGGSLKSKLAHILGKLLYKKYIDVKFAPSGLAAEYTFGKKALINNEVSILHNGVDLNVFHYDNEARYKIRNEFAIKDNQYVIGHIGRFDYQKNHAFLLDVFKEMSNKNDNSVLMLVGDGILEQQIKDKIKALDIEDKVIFTGVRSDIPQLLSAMDVFVFPSFYEGMPNTVIEAQATGLPCVIADTITKEADITGLVQYLALSNSAEKWANVALGSIKSTRMDTKENFVENGYDIESVTKKFTQLVFKED